MSVRDYLETFGGAVGELGIPNRRFASPLATGVSSALASFAYGSRMKRGLEEGRRFQAAKAQFEAKVGIPYELFAKLSGTAQTEIMRNVGMLPDPYNAPIGGEFGDRSVTELNTMGAPGRMAPAAGVGAFEGLGGLSVGEQQAGPSLPPLDLYGKTGPGRTAAIDRYLGVEPPVALGTQSLIDYRNQRLDMLRGETRGRKLLRQSQIDRNRASIKAMEALTQRRARPDAAVDPWEIEVGRAMGLMIPQGVTPTRSQLDGLLKYNRPAMAVISKSDELAMAIRQAEIERGVTLSEKEIDKLIANNSPELEALAGPNSIPILSRGVKAQLLYLRQSPNSFFTPAGGPETETAEDEDLNNNGIPDYLEDEEVVEEGELEEEVR